MQESSSVDGNAGDEESARTNERPWIFGLLIAPSAVIANGVIQGGVLAFLFSGQHMSSGGASHIIGLLALPTSLYFLWSPITDFVMRRRSWLITGSVLSAVLMALAFHQKDLGSNAAVILMLLSACFSQLVVSSCGGMMGALRVERSRRVAGSFYQGGSLAFGAASVSVLIGLYPRVGRDLLGIACAAMTALPALFALAAPEQDVVAKGSFGETMRTIWSEFKSTFWRWEALPYTLCMVFPMASGAAVGLLSGVAQSYGVNGDHVAWVNGLGGALLMGTGTLAAMLISPRIRAATAYVAMGVVNAATLGVLWLGPLRPATYYVGLALYLFTIGTCYAMFTGVVLEFLGKSGKSGSGRYSIINSMGNVPVLYMIVLDGWGADRFGARGLAGTEAVVGGVGGLVLLVYFLSQRRRGMLA
jgi:PAT family beta-lactamase induction signal transducer AmpG